MHPLGYCSVFVNLISFWIPMLCKTQISCDIYLYCVYLFSICCAFKRHILWNTFPDNLLDLYFQESVWYILDLFNEKKLSLNKCLKKHVWLVLSWYGEVFLYSFCFVLVGGGVRSCNVGVVWVVSDSDLWWNYVLTSTPAEQMYKNMYTMTVVL